MKVTPASLMLLSKWWPVGKISFRDANAPACTNEGLDPSPRLCNEVIFSGKLIFDCCGVVLNRGR
jgi:hypothetical protein